MRTSTIAIASVFVFFAQTQATLGSFNNTRDLGCLWYSKRPQTSYHTYFVEPSHPHQILAISTEWYHYSLDLQRILPAAGFDLAREPNRTVCDWKWLFNVRKYGNSRGIVTYKVHDDTSLVARSMNFSLGRRPDPAAATVRTQPPSDKTIKRIKYIMLNNAPVRDILEQIASLVGPLLGLLLVGIAAVYFISYLTPKMHVKNGAEDIELSEFKSTTTVDVSSPELPCYLESTKYPETRCKAFEGLELGTTGEGTYDWYPYKQGETYPVAYHPY